MPPPRRGGLIKTSIHGFRSARPSAGYTSPVATFRGSVGAEEF
jgi:hypothetical protein